MRYVVIYPNGTLDHRAGPSSEFSDVLEGWLESPSVLNPDIEHLTMFCNEEGKLLQLPANMHATHLVGYYPHDIICGNIILTGPVDNEGDTTDIDPKDVGYILDFLGLPKKASDVHATQ